MIILIIILGQNFIKGQTIQEIKIEDPQSEYASFCSLPTYKGGIAELKKFIYNNLNYPEIAKKNGISGVVQLSYIINKEGRIENIQIVKGLSLECNEEAKRE